jgi:hypothetical protein
MSRFVEDARVTRMLTAGPAPWRGRTKKLLTRNLTPRRSTPRRGQSSEVQRFGVDLAAIRVTSMRIVWLIPVTILIIGASAFLRSRRNRGTASFSQEPVSGQWLAEARTREEQPW